jgi:multidrug resistance efflux pump
VSPCHRNQLRDAQNRIKELEANVRYYQDRADCAEKMAVSNFIRDREKIYWHGPRSPRGTLWYLNQLIGQSLTLSHDVFPTVDASVSLKRSRSTARRDAPAAGTRRRESRPPHPRARASVISASVRLQRVKTEHPESGSVINFFASSGDLIRPLRGTFVYTALAFDKVGKPFGIRFELVGISQ